MSPANNPPKPDKPSPPKPSPGGPATPPAEPESSAGRGRLLPLLAVLLVVGAGVLIVLAVTRHPAKQVTNQQELSPAPPAESISAPVSNPPPPVPAAAVSNAPAAPPPPTLKLQGIVYDSVRPWAIVDGKTVYPGSRVGDCRVKAISQNTLTLEDTNGSLKTLFLGK
jgi:hypothetical protein